jgi:hypothetical protein
MVEFAEIADRGTHGEYIALSDDDDYSAPQRLEVKAQHLQSSGKAVTVFNQIPFRQGDEWFLSPRGPTELTHGLGIDSSLFFRRSWWEAHKFVHQQLSQDATFIRQAAAGEPLITELAHGGVRLQVGSPIQDFRTSWANAVTRAHAANKNVKTDLLFHDLRRSAIRLMVQEAGIPESQAMLISGHETRSMLERYNIVSIKNVQDAGAKLDA